MNHLNRVAVVDRSDGGISITHFSRIDMVWYGFCVTTYAEIDRKNAAVNLKSNRVKLEDLPISFTSQNEDDFIAWYMNRVFPGQPFDVISEDDLPKSLDGTLDRSERNEWSLDKPGKRVIVDPAKRAAKQEKEARKQAVLFKLGITKEDFPSLR